MSSDERKLFEPDNGVSIMFKAALALAFVVCLPLAAAAESYPNRAITLVVPYAAGGTNDIIARAVAAKITTSLGQPVVIENRSGAGGNLGAQLVARAPADGYTMLIASVGVLAINKSIYAHPGYDAEKDFAPITEAGTVPNVLLANATVPANNVSELVAYAKSHPKTLTIASMGAGTTGHLCGEMFQRGAGIDLVHVAYRGSAPALQDMLGGHVNVMFDNLPTALPLVKAGTLKAFAVTSAQRSESLPNVPTLAEAGITGFEATSWFGFVAPAATPAPILERLNNEIVKALNDPDVREKLQAQGVTTIANTREEFARVISSETSKWKAVVDSAGVKVE